MDEGFSFSSEIKLYKLDVTSDSDFLKEVGSFSPSYRFQNLSWSPAGDYPLGLIAGGMENGAVSFWNVGALEAGEDSGEDDSPCILENTIFEDGSPVKDVDFNVCEPNLLAACGNKFFVFDINKELKTPFDPAQNAPPMAKQTVCEWNRSVPHILALGLGTGDTQVWDMRVNRPILKISSSQRQSVSSISWNAERPTQLATTNEDDENSAVLLWDLRNAHSPEKELRGHSKGALSVDWCVHDPSLLLTCGKDKRAIIWSISTGNVLGELPFSQNWNFEAKWSPQIPAILSISSFDTNFRIFGLHDIRSNKLESDGDFVEETVEEDDFLAPGWLKCQIGASFGFGGKLISFSNPKNEDPRVEQVSIATENDFISKAYALSEVLEKKSYKEFCAKKVEEKGGGSLLWGFIEEFFGENSKENILNLLGFNMTQMNEEMSRFLEEAEDCEEEEEEADSKRKKATEGYRLNINNALIAADYETAVKLALKYERVSEALIFAQRGGKHLWDMVAGKYLREHVKKNPYLAIILGSMSNDLTHIVEYAVVEGDKWKETLALLIQYGNDDLSEYCRLLGKKLEDAGRSEVAAFLYLVAKDVPKLVEIWAGEYNAADAKLRLETLTSFVERICLVEAFVEAKYSNKDLFKLFSSYAYVLASQGELSLASKFIHLEFLGVGVDEELDSLRNRISTALSMDFVKKAEEKPVPVPKAKEEVPKPQAPLRQPVQDTITSPAPVPVPVPGLSQAQPQPQAPTALPVAQPVKQINPVMQPYSGSGMGQPPLSYGMPLQTRPPQQFQRTQPPSQMDFFPPQPSGQDYNPRGPVQGTGVGMQGVLPPQPMKPSYGMPPVMTAVNQPPPQKNPEQKFSPRSDRRSEFTPSPSKEKHPRPTNEPVLNDFKRDMSLDELPVGARAIFAELKRLIDSSPNRKKIEEHSQSKRGLADLYNRLAAGNSDEIISFLEQFLPIAKDKVKHGVLFRREALKFRSADWFIGLKAMSKHFS